jgi:hypothetical protein
MCMLHSESCEAPNKNLHAFFSALFYMLLFSTHILTRSLIFRYMNIFRRQPQRRTQGYNTTYNISTRFSLHSRLVQNSKSLCTLYYYRASTNHQICIQMEQPVFKIDQIRGTIPRNNSSRRLFIFIFCRYMFRPSLAILRRYTQYFLEITSLTTDPLFLCYKSDSNKLIKCAQQDAKPLK